MRVPVLPSTSYIPPSWALLPLLGLLWGSSFLWISILNGALDLAMLVFARVIAASLVILPVMWLRGARMPAFGAIWLHILVIAVAADLLPFFLLVWAQHHVASSVAAVLSATIPLFTLLTAALIFRNDVITPERLAGILLGFAGVAVLSGMGGGAGGSLVNPGVVAVIGSSLFYGMGFAYARRHVRGDPFGIVGLQMLMSLALVLPLTLATGQFDPAAVSPGIALAVLGQGMFSSGIGYVVYYVALDRLGPTVTSYGAYLSPIVAIFLGWAVLGERIGVAGFAGILLVAAGILTAAGYATAALQALAPHPQPAAVPEDAPVLPEVVIEEEPVLAADGVV